MTKHFTNDQVAHWAKYHPPGSQDVINAHEQIRAEFGGLLVRMNNLLPEGPDKSATLRAIRVAMMEANACIACNHPDNLS